MKNLVKRFLVSADMELIIGSWMNASSAISMSSDRVRLFPKLHVSTFNRETDDIPIKEV